MREWVLLEFLAGRIGVTLLRRELHGEASDALPAAALHGDLELELLPLGHDWLALRLAAAIDRQEPGAE